jgi:predicted DNA binding protein
MGTLSGSTSKILIHMPDKLWLGELSRLFPQYRFEITAFIPIRQEPFVGNSLVKITGVNPSQILLRLDHHPSIRAYFVMDQSPTQLTVNTQTEDNFLLQALIRNHILVRLPVLIDNGTAVFNINSSRENIDRFITELTSKGIKTELKILGNYTEDTNAEALTPRQLEIYKKARESGFYNAPRQISLTDLAIQLGIAKSSLSGILQRVHKKLLGS